MQLAVHPRCARLAVAAGLHKSVAILLPCGSRTSALCVVFALLLGRVDAHARAAAREAQSPCNLLEISAQSPAPAISRPPSSAVSRNLPQSPAISRSLPQSPVTPIPPISLPYLGALPLPFTSCSFSGHPAFTSARRGCSTACGRCSRPRRARRPRRRGMRISRARSTGRAPTSCRSSATEATMLRGQSRRSAGSLRRGTRAASTATRTHERLARGWRRGSHGAQQTSARARTSCPRAAGTRQRSRRRATRASSSASMRRRSQSTRRRCPPAQR